VNNRSVNATCSSVLYPNAEQTDHVANGEQHRGKAITQLRTLSTAHSADWPHDCPSQGIRAMEEHANRVCATVNAGEIHTVSVPKK
jgi:hypothetical protein